MLHDFGVSPLLTQHLTIASGFRRSLPSRQQRSLQFPICFPALWRYVDIGSNKNRKDTRDTMATGGGVVRTLETPPISQTNMQTRLAFSDRHGDKKYGRLARPMQCCAVGIKNRELQNGSAAQLQSGSAAELRLSHQTACVHVATLCVCVHVCVRV